MIISKNAKMARLKTKKAFMTTLHKILLGLFFALLAWSAYKPYDYFIWALEAAPCAIGLIILALTYKKFKFTNFTYVFIFLHCIVLLVGAKYSYALVPLFDWIKDAFELSRNNYDKVGHFAQGFVPALITREVLIRFEVVKNRSWLFVFILSICLSISALYELIEWFTAVVTKDGAEAFLGMQGYEWDTQADMFYALSGALCMLIFFSKWQDGHINALNVRHNI
jgi:putative membrane protein